MPTVHSSRAVPRGTLGRPRSTTWTVTGTLAVATAGLLAAGCGPPPEVDSEDDPRGAPGVAPTSPTTPGSPSASASLPPGSLPQDPTNPGLPDSPGLPDDPPDPPGDPSLGGDEPTFPEEIALACGNHLPADDILALLQHQDVLPDDHEAEVVDGPYCAGQWHYSQVAVPGRDPLQTVSRRTEDQLTLVTAGTDVCTVEVRVRAPAGIRRTAACRD